MRYVVVSGLVGTGLTSWLAPKVIAWYFDPPVNIGVNCKQATEWSMRQLQNAQFFGLICGGVFGLVLFLTLRSKKKNGSSGSDVPTDPII